MPRMTKAEKAAIVEKTVAIGREMKRIANEGFKVLKGPFEAKYDDSLNIDIICAGEHFTHQIDPNKSIGDNFADFSKTDYFTRKKPGVHDLETPSSAKETVQFTVGNR